jgi:hypothetical protein
MSIFSKIGGFFKNLFGKEQNWEKAATITLDVATPLVGTLLTLTAGPAASTAVVAIIGQIQADLKSVNDVIVSAGPAPTAESYLNSILANLKELEASADIKNSTNATAVTLITTTLTDEVEAILAELPSSSLPTGVPGIVTAAAPSIPATPASKK